MERGLDSFRQLQAQAALGFADKIGLSKVKTAAVSLTLAAVVAVGAMAPQHAHANDSAFPDEPAATQQVQPEWASKETAVGAGLGAVAGNIFGALTGMNRAASAAVGAVVGGVIGAVEAGSGKVAELQGTAPAQAKAGAEKLSQERDVRMAKLQLEAVSKRVEYVEALKAAKEAEIDKSLMPSSKEAQAKYQQSVVEASKALRAEKEATKNFNGAFESLLGKYDVSAYSASYAKLKQPVRINDASYGDLAKQAVENLMVKGSANDTVKVKHDRVSSGMF